MSNKGWILTGLVAVLFYKVFRSVQALRISLQKYEFTSLNLTDGTTGMYLYFTIVNPLWVGITLREISGELTASSGEQQETLGTVFNRYNYYIRGNATHTVRAAITVNNKSVLDSIIQNVQSGDINNLLLTFNGKMVFGGNREVALPIRRTMTVNELIGK